MCQFCEENGLDEDDHPTLHFTMQEAKRLHEELNYIIKESDGETYVFVSKYVSNLQLREEIERSVDGEIEYKPWASPESWRNDFNTVGDYKDGWFFCNAVISDGVAVNHPAIHDKEETR